jgi:hypothetical protein
MMEWEISFGTEIITRINNNETNLIKELRTLKANYEREANVSKIDGIKDLLREKARKGCTKLELDKLSDEVATYFAEEGFIVEEGPDGMDILRWT